MATITINRPERRNSLSAEVIDLFIAALDDVEQDDDVLFDGVPGIWDSKYTATTQTTFDVNPLPETGDGHAPVVDHATQMEFDAL